MGKYSSKRATNKNGGTNQTQKDKQSRYWKALRIGAVIGIIEAMSLVLWIKSEDFEPQAAHFLRNLATCGFLAGAAYLAHKLTGGKFKKWIIGLIWVAWIGLCVIALLTKSEQPEQHVVLSMQIGDSPDDKITLTNRYLCRASLINIITNLPDGFSFFNGLPVGFMIVPMRPGESNTVFTFIAKNDSPLPVANLEMTVGFPKDWKLGLDSDKWHTASLRLFAGGSELTLTNLQGRMAACPYILYPGDWVNFPPITNFGSDIWYGPPTRIEHFELVVRSPGFEQILAANVVFMRSPSNFFKPFLIPAVPTTNGNLRPLISTNELLKEIEDLAE